MKVMIEAAINGNHMRDKNPHVPWTPKEIADDAIACCEAGASLVHFHVRDAATGAWTQDVGDYAEATLRIRERCDPILWPTFPGGADPRKRFAHMYALSADPATRPDLGLCDTGSVNLATWDPAARTLSGERIYENSYEHMRYFLAACRELGLKPTLQVFDASFLRAIRVLLAQELLDEPLMVKFYLGGATRPIGLPPTRQSLQMYLAMLDGVRCNWFGSALGCDVLPLLPDIIELGGHVRVGYEDYLHADGERPLRNAEIVARAAAAVRALGHEVATPAEARAMSGI